jgi:hypothetical protein
MTIERFEIRVQVVRRQHPVPTQNPLPSHLLYDVRCDLSSSVSVLSRHTAEGAHVFSSFSDVIRLDPNGHFQPFLFQDIVVPSHADHAFVISDSFPVFHDLTVACSALSVHMTKFLDAFLKAPFGRSCFSGTTVSTTPELTALIDSGANVHVLSWDAAVTLFQTFQKSSLTVVGVNGASTPADISGALTITVQGPGDALYSFDIGTAHGMRKCPMNLLSLSLMIDLGCVFHFDKDNCWMDCPYDSRTVGGPVRIPL